MNREWLRLWWLHLLAAVAVVGCIAGGLWQMGVYGDRQDDAGAPDAVLFKGAFLGSPFHLPDGEGRTWVVEPFRPNDDIEGALLVVRGYGEEAPVSHESRIRAVVRPSDGTVRLPRLINQTDVPLRDEYAIALTDTGLPLVPPPSADVSWTVGARNLAYAMQWWVFGAFAIVMWWRICHDQVASRRENE